MNSTPSRYETIFGEQAAAPDACRSKVEDRSRGGDSNDLDGRGVDEMVVIDGRPREGEGNLMGFANFAVDAHANAAFRDDAARGPWARRPSCVCTRR